MWQQPGQGSVQVVKVGSPARTAVVCSSSAGHGRWYCCCKNNNVGRLLSLHNNIPRVKGVFLANNFMRELLCFDLRVNFLLGTTKNVWRPDVINMKYAGQTSNQKPFIFCTTRREDCDPSERLYKAHRQQ